ncbi:MAG: orotate phosphoribosyltransferase [Candidatus Bathyarchaeota archaeon]
MSRGRDIEAARIDICRILNRINALRFGTFKLTGGKISPYYIDLRLISSFPDAFRRTCEIQTDFIRKKIGLENFDRIAGLPLAGLPFASVIAYNLEKPFLYIRKDVRRHGRKRKIEGVLTPGNRVMLIDDLITSGLSVIRAAEAVRVEGGVTTDALVILDREEGGTENLKNENIELHSLFNISELAHKLEEIGAINKVQMETILKQTKRTKKNKT